MANIDCPRRSQAHDIQPAYITSLHPDFPPLTPNNIQYGISSTLPHSHVYPCSSVLRPRHSWALDAHTDSPNPPFYEWATSNLQRELLYTQFDHPMYSGPAYYNNYDARPIYKPRGKAQKNQNPCSHCKLRKKKVNPFPIKYMRQSNVQLCLYLRTFSVNLSNKVFVSDARSGDKLDVILIPSKVQPLMVVTQGN